MSDVADRPAIPDPVAAIALLDEPRRRALYEYVTSRREPVGRDEAARALGMGRELAAFHLDRLAGAGLLDVEFRRLSGRSGPGAGRPAKLYRRSASEASASFPSRDYARLAELLAGAVEVDPDHAAQSAADEAARARGRQEGSRARAKAGPRAGTPQLRAGLIELLADVGYEPAAVADPAEIRLQNCPYHALVANHRQLTCGMNLAWAHGVIEGLGDPGFEANLAPEPGYCCVVFSERNSTAPGETDGVAGVRPKTP
jgi:predicted ArsR family transcriptional regulator